MKRPLIIVVILLCASSLCACSVQEPLNDMLQAFKEECPYFFCTLDEPNPI